jgi:anti-sigma factor RsiW
MEHVTCRELIEFLDDYVDGTLPALQRLRFDDHLAGCPHCVSYLRTYQDTIDLSRGACAGDDEALPAGVPEELVQAVLRARSGAG